MPKQLLTLGGRTILERSIAPFVSHERVSDIVVALPSDLVASPPLFLAGLAPRVRLVAGRLEVDGQSVPEPYLAGPTSSGELELQLGPAEYLVLCDHRAASTDGRDFGPVGADALVGRVRFAYWPPRRLPRG